MSSLSPLASRLTEAMEVVEENEEEPSSSSLSQKAEDRLRSEFEDWEHRRKPGIARGEVCSCRQGLREECHVTCCFQESLSDEDRVSLPFVLGGSQNFTLHCPCSYPGNVMP